MKVVAGRCSNPLPLAHYQSPPILFYQHFIYFLNMHSKLVSNTFINIKIIEQKMCKYENMIYTTPQIHKILKKLIYLRGMYLYSTITLKFEQHNTIHNIQT